MEKRKTGQLLHVLQVVGDPVGGIRKHVHSLIAKLDDSEFVQSYAYSDTATDTIFKKEIEDFRTQLKGVIALHIRKKPHFSDLTNLWVLVRYVKSAKVDIVHGHGAKGGFYARLVGMACHIPAVYTPHGGVVHRMFGFWEDRLYTFVERCLVRSTSCFVFESSYSKENFHAKIGNVDRPSLVNYNGVECFPMVADKNVTGTAVPDETNIGVFGRLCPEKGQIHLINAVASIIKSDHGNVRLHIFGDGPDRDVLEKQVANSGMAETITFYGDVPNAEEWMAKMDIIAIPSLFESLSYVGLEAMALSKPVIASAVGGLREILDSETALLVPPGDEMALCRAIIQCTQNPELTAAMAKRGMLRCAENFSLDNMLKVISNCYRNTVLF